MEAIARNGERRRMGQTDQPWPGREYRIDVAQDVLDDLRERLARTRFPQGQSGPDWGTGTPLDYARRLHDHWLNRFDWRAYEARLNRFEQRMIDVDGHPIHVIVERGSGSDPTPLLLANGWPSSFVEMVGLVERLAHPERFGGDAESGVTVIIPGMPGYGFSPPPPEAISPGEVARLWSKMMTKIFGFERYVVFGCDWGSAVGGILASQYSEGLAGLVMTTTGGVLDVGPNDPPLTAEEMAWLGQMQRQMAPESAYQMVQGTKPQSLAYSHADSPMGLACWIVEKFHGWTINGQQADPPFAMDDLLANVMIYWVNGSLAPMWLYMYLGAFKASNERSRVPAGFIFPPADMIPPAPRSYVERMYEDVRHYRVLDAGGHFPALEIPDVMIEELQRFLRACERDRS